MKTWKGWITLMIFLLALMKTAAQVPVLDSICSGAVRHYAVDGENGSTYSWIVTPPAGPVVILPSDNDSIEISWAYPGGIYGLQVIQHGLNGCDADAVYGQVYIFDQPSVYAGPTDYVCLGRTYKLIDANAENCGSLMWATTGDGNFDNDTVLHPVYTPGSGDMASGSVILTLMGTGILGNEYGCDPSYSSMMLAIVTEIVPEFEPVGPLCQHSTPPALPDTSLQGITGNWIPSVINTDFLGTFPYTFSPDDPAQCGVDTTLLITITDEIVPLFEPIGSLCINSVPPALPDTSLEGITGIWEPAVIATGDIGVFVYNFTPDDPSQCGLPTTMEIAIADRILPLFDPIGPLCQYSTPPPLPVVSLNGISGSWEPPVITTGLTGTFVFTFNPDTNECGLVTTMEITINPQVIPVFEQIDPVCQYTEGPPLPSSSLNNITGTWYPPVIITAWPGIFTYTFTPDPATCGAVVTMEITILPEIIPEFDTIGPLCRYSIPPLLPPVSLNGVTGSWNPPVITTDVPGTYFHTFTPDTLIPCAMPITLVIEVLEVITPSFGPIGPLCLNSVPPALPGTSAEGILGTWEPLVIITTDVGTFIYEFTPDAGQCALSASLEITILDEIMPVFNPIGPLCINTIPPELPGTSLNGITGAWVPPVIETSVAGITAYVFTPDSGQCGLVFIMDVEVSGEIDPLFTPIGPLCLNSIPPLLPGTSLNGITGTWAPPDINTAIAGITVYALTPDSGQCGMVAMMSIEVTDEIIPVFEQIGPLCELSPPVILPLHSNNNPVVTGIWTPPTVNTSTPGTVICTFTPDPGQCAVEVTMAIEITEQVLPLFDPIGPLSQNSPPPPLPGTSLNGIAGNWSPDIIDTSIPGTFTYFFAADTGQCAENTDMEITVQSDKLQAITGPGRQCLGDAAIVPVDVDKFCGVALFQLKLSFNADKLWCEGYMNLHPQLENIFTGTVDNNNGVITLDWHSAEPVTFGCKQKVCELVFIPKEPGQEELVWYTGPAESYFRDLNGMAIPAEFFSEELIFYQPPEVLLPDSKTVCEGGEVNLISLAISSYPPVSYRWTYPDGDTSNVDPYFSSITMNDGGDYTLLATDSLGCTDQKSIRLTVSGNPVAEFHGADTLHVNSGYILDAGYGMASYSWNTGETTESIIITNEGRFSVTMITDAGCIGIDSVYIIISEFPEECLYIPNAFTPNYDGLNDVFRALSACPVGEFKMLIFNRWGEMIFESDDISRGWDGTKNGVPCPGDGYVYKITYRNSEVSGENEIVKVGSVIILK